jgi:glycosyltransferase involved in cell wall biosynthesis
MAAAIMKPKLLFISPILPSPDGPGLAMRPYYQIVSLSRSYAIHLLVVADRMPGKPPTDGKIEAYCDMIEYMDRLRFSGWKFSLWHRVCRLIDQATHLIRGDTPGFAVDLGDRHYLRHHPTLAKLYRIKFDRVHVFRFYLFPVAEILKKRGLDAFYSIDIDDIESETRHSISALLSVNGEVKKAAAMSRDSAVFFTLEARKIPEYHQIFTCSHHDQSLLKKRFPGKDISVLPNVIPLTKRVRIHKTNSVFTLLFVGTMGYYPNADAVCFFAEQIAPVLRDKSRVPWQLRVVGTVSDQAWIGRFASHPEIKFVGWVEDLGPEYDTTDIVVAPIRGGGGTRIKILEAFSHGIPVVSTVKGAEGLDVENGEHLLMEDDPRRFALACLKLMNDSEMADALSCCALDLMKTRYSPQAVHTAWTGQSLESIT